MHENYILNIGCHYIWPGLLALPKNTLHCKKKLRPWRLPKIEVSIKSLSAFTFGLLGEKGRTLGKTYGIKARCYWEHPWGTIWELDGNMLGTVGKKMRKILLQKKKISNFFIPIPELSLVCGRISLLSVNYVR